MYLTWYRQFEVAASGCLEWNWVAVELAGIGMVLTRGPGRDLRDDDTHFDRSDRKNDAYDGQALSDATTAITAVQKTRSAQASAFDGPLSLHEPEADSGRLDEPNTSKREVE